MNFFLSTKDGTVEELSGPVSDERELVEVTDLQIIRAILERSRRRWQFVWNGIRIPAPVLDEAFYTDSFEHKIVIGPGDILRVRLRIKQKREPDLGAWIQLLSATVNEILVLKKTSKGVR